MKRIALFVVCFVLLLVGIFTIEVETAPPANTRMILENTHQTYISPPCYEQAQKTNNLSEADLKKAKDLNYQPESSCTKESLTPIKQPIAYALAEKMGVKQSKWDW